MVYVIIAVAALIIGGFVGYLFFRYVLKGKYNEMIDAAEKEANVLKEKKLLEVKEKFINKKSELEKEVQQRNQKIQQSENRLKQREINLNQRQEELGRRRQEVEQFQQRVDNEKKLLALKEEELEKLQLKEREKLEELSGLSADEARTRLVESLKDEARTNAAAYINEIMDEAKLNANQQAKKIVIQTIQRVATETAVENSVSVFHIDNDEVKGRIIGREGRNIRALEAACGVEIVVDDTPEALHSTQSVVKSAVSHFISLWLTDVSIRLVSRKLWQRSRNSLTMRLSKQVSVPLSTSVFTVSTQNLCVS